MSAPAVELLAWAQMTAGRVATGAVDESQSGQEVVTAAGIAVGAMIAFLTFLLVCFGLWVWRLRRRQLEASDLDLLPPKPPDETPAKPRREEWERPDDWWKK